MADGPAGAPRRAPEIDLGNAGGGGRGVGTLGPWLAWAVVFADLGTSIYYVPNVLYGQLGALAPAFVFVVTIAFVLVAAEHLEVAHRFRAGGGVAAAIEAFGVRVGVVSGALMITAYLLAIALTVVTAMHHVTAVFPAWEWEALAFSAVAIPALGFASWRGVSWMARMALGGALAVVGAQIWLLFEVARRISASDLVAMLVEVGQVGELPWTQIASGLAAAWLAFSGLESLGQIAPSLREPRTQVIRKTTALLIGSVLVTVPLFTALAVQAASRHGIEPQGALMAAVALDYGGRPLQIAVSLTGAFLLLLAAKFAFIGCFNVFHILGEHGYLPAVLARSDSYEKAPRGAALLVTACALALTLLSGGQPRSLAALFAFGLLGSYVITSISLDVIRWRERRLGPAFVLGLLASLALLLPWVTSWLTKPKATLYGALGTGAILVIALFTHRGWIRSGRFGFLTAARAEESATALSTAVEVLTLKEADELREAYPSTTLIAVRGPNPGLCREAARRARGVGDAAVFVIYVDEIPGFLFPARRGPSREALRVLRAASAEIRDAGLEPIPIWRLAHDAGASIAEAAESLGAKSVFIGTTQRGAVWHFLQGSVLKRLIKELPDDIHVVICQ